MNPAVSVRITNSPAACISGTDCGEFKYILAAVKKRQQIFVETEATLSNGEMECVFQRIDLVRQRKNNLQPAVNVAIISSGNLLHTYSKLKKKKEFSVVCNDFSIRLLTYNCINWNITSILYCNVGLCCDALKLC